VQLPKIARISKTEQSPARSPVRGDAGAGAEPRSPDAFSFGAKRAAAAAAAARGGGARRRDPLRMQMLDGREAGAGAELRTKDAGAGQAAEDAPRRARLSPIASPRGAGAGAARARAAAGRAEARRPVALERDPLRGGGGSGAARRGAPPGAAGSRGERVGWGWGRDGSASGWDGPAAGGGGGGGEEEISALTLRLRELEAQVGDTPPKLRPPLTAPNPLFPPTSAVDPFNLSLFQLKYEMGVSQVGTFHRMLAEGEIQRVGAVRQLRFKLHGSFGRRLVHAPQVRAARCDQSRPDGARLCVQFALTGGGSAQGAGLAALRDTVSGELALAGTFWLRYRDADGDLLDVCAPSPRD
jgi:hypothetical protein